MVTFKKQKLALCAALFTSACGFSQFATAQDEQLEEVVVTGFRASLEAALDIKRDATGQSDAIIAEDIADFPDLNLAESLQRISGVAITRNDGEGARVTVRGLGAQYTRTRINGMDVRAGALGNNTRAFDFNMFASELFSSIVVEKTTRAELGAGSLGAVIDMSTGRALSYDEGSTFLASAQMQYNDTDGDTSPRLALMYAYNGGNWGLTTSLAYQDLSTLLNSSNTVRWQKSRFRTVDGNDCSLSPEPAACAAVTDAFHARIPRYSNNPQDRERIGFTLGLQFQPTDATLVSFDALISKFDRERTSQVVEVLFRGNEGGMDVLNPVIVSYPTSGIARGNSTTLPNSNNSIVAMTVNNAWVRSEAFAEKIENDFDQFSLSVEHSFSDRFRMSALAGVSSSESWMPYQTTLMFDDRDYNGFSYDYRSGSEPTLAYRGPDVTDPTIYQLTDVRDGTQRVEHDSDTLEINVEYDFSDAAVLKGGISRKTQEMFNIQNSRNGSACGYNFYDCATNGTVGMPITADLAVQSTYKGAVGAGSTTRWATPNIDAVVAATGFYGTPLRDQPERTRGVEEVETGAFVQLSGEVDLSGMRFLYDLGVNYVKTDQTSGANVARGSSFVWRDVKRDYTDTLPSFNTALWFNDEVVLRFGAAQVLARPALSNLSPGVTVSSFTTLRVQEQNPYLDPTRADNVDLAIEWYFADDAALGFAYYTKDIESFPTNQTIDETTYAAIGYPVSYIEPTSATALNPEGPPLAACRVENGGNGCWEHRFLVNGPGADVKGWELNFQSSFASLFGDDIPTVLANMGVTANYTSVDSDTNYTYLGTALTERLQGLSEDQWNFTLWYEGEKFSTRVSWAHRSDYINNGSADRNRNLYEFVEDATYIDLSASYIINDNFTVSLEVVNLTDEPFNTTVDQDARRLFTYDLTGTNYLLGLRYKF